MWLAALSALAGQSVHWNAPYSEYLPASQSAHVAGAYMEHTHGLPAEHSVVSAAAPATYESSDELGAQEQPAAPVALALNTVHASASTAAPASHSAAERTGEQPAAEQVPEDTCEKYEVSCVPAAHEHRGAPLAPLLRAGQSAHAVEPAVEKVFAGQTSGARQPPSQVVPGGQTMHGPPLGPVDPASHTQSESAPVARGLEEWAGHGSMSGPPGQ